MKNKERLQSWEKKNFEFFVKSILEGKQHCELLHLPKNCKKYRHNCEKCRNAWLNEEYKDKKND